MTNRWKPSILGLAAILWFALPLAAVTKQDKQAELRDQQITHAVETAMLNDGDTPSFLINTVTVDGIVALAGTVDNVLAKERAVEIAKSVEGVRAVVDRVNLAPPLRPDEEIRQDVIKKLQSNTATDPRKLKIAAADGVVTMRGAVDSHAEEDLCIQAARGIPGVIRVDARLQIKPGAPRDDREIEEEINARLKSDVWIDSSLINVAVHGGVVTLSGVVGTAAEKAQAAINAQVAGVTKVNTGDLEVSRYADDDARRSEVNGVPTQSQISSALEDALRFDPRVAPDGIEVSVKNATVTLRGTVATAAAKTRAAEDALNTVGVSRVENRLWVRMPEPQPDSVLEAALQAAIERDPYIQGRDLRASVTGHVAALSGNVHSKFERRQAAQLAKSIPGVSGVVNNLTVGQENAPAPDWEIRSAIQTGLYWSPLVDSDDILVTVENGVATLSGNVDTKRQYQAAREIALDEGARKVNNNLKVAGAAPRTSVT